MSMQGIPYWMAPDVNLQTGHSFSADIWSVGCTIIEMATGKPPWSEQYQEVAALFHIDTTNSHPPISDHLSAEAKDFLLQCLQKEPKLRPTACELLQHSFVTKDSWQSCPIASTSSMSFNPLCEPVDWSCKFDGTPEVECKTTFDDNKGIPVDVQHDLVSGGMKFYEVQKDRKEELDQEFGRKRVDPPTVMDSDVLARDTDLKFIFNESKHSDRTLRIEIVSDYDTLDSFSDLVRPWNHMTVDAAKKYYACSDSNSSMECPTILTVETLHIFSPLLESKSPFFRKLFSGGMKESAQLYVTLRINASEKAALMELLEFMYSDTLRVTDAPALLDVLMIADKFDVPSCMRYCCDMLLKLPMTYDTSLLYLGLPSGVLMADTVQPLIGAAKQFLAVSFRDVSKFNDGIMRLPLVGIEALLASDELQVESEDALYDLVLKWSRIHYPEIQMRKDVMIRLCAVLRFPFMSSRKLEEVLYCPDLDPMLASKMVVEAFRFKADASFRQRVLAPKESVCDNRFVERGYKYHAVKIVHYSLPMHKCIVFMDLARKDCEELFTLGRVDLQVIHLGGQGFFLSAHCNLDRQRSSRCFGLFLGKLEKGSAVSAIKYEFAVMENFNEEYATIYKGLCDLPGGKAVGYRNLFGLHWSEFISQL